MRTTLLLYFSNILSGESGSISSLQENKEMSVKKKKKFFMIL
jgi:hypothetical protein